MRRRKFITLVGGALVGWPLAARAQQAGPVRLIGILMEQAESNSAAQSWLASFRDELAKLGWKEDNNLRIELRWSAGNAERVRTFAKELVDLRPDAILGRGTSETIALARETRAIPIVFAGYPIRSVTALPRVSRVRAATSPASRMSSPPWAVNGWNY